MTDTRPRLLWIDDDERERFLFEIDCLEEAGWQVEWASAGPEALERLATEEFRAILVDQSFRFYESDLAPDVWSGCRIVHWLQGRKQPAEAPESSPWQDELTKWKPKPANSMALCLIISAFWDEQVDAAFKRLEPSPELLVKPINERALLDRLQNHLELAR